MNSLQLSVWDAAEEARRATSLADLATVTRRYAKASGFKHHGFAVKFPNHVGDGGENYHHFYNVPEPWGRHRYEDTYRSEAVNQDPLIQHLRAGCPPTAFSSRGIVTHTRTEIIRRASSALQQAGDHGLNAGILAPLSGPGMSWGFMVLTTDNTSDVREVLPTLPSFCFFAHFVLCTARNLLNAIRPEPRLTPREREILRWVAMGKTSWEIGRILSLSEKTIDFHLYSAARKLDVSGRCAAVGRAVALGLIVL